MGFLFDEFSATILEVLGAAMIITIIGAFFAITAEPNSNNIFFYIWTFIQSLVGA